MKCAEASREAEAKKYVEEIESLKEQLQSLQDQCKEQSSRAEMAESRMAELEKTDPSKQAEEKVVLDVGTWDAYES